jgi:hypothetical protein
MPSLPIILSQYKPIRSVAVVLVVQTASILTGSIDPATAFLKTTLAELIAELDVPIGRQCTSPPTPIYNPRIDTSKTAASLGVIVIANCPGESNSVLYVENGSAGFGSAISIAPILIKFIPNGGYIYIKSTIIIWP